MEQLREKDPQSIKDMGTENVISIMRVFLIE